MGNRLTKIYTRTGDTGDTGMADGTRVSKDDVLIHVQGDIDELNSILGLLASQLSDKSYKEIILSIQNDLFDLGSEISLSQVFIQQENIDWLEKTLDELNDDLSPLKEFILPGGGEASALSHLARSVCRRVERHLVALSKKKAINPDLLAYINRLSDLLFVFARSVAKHNGETEVYWQSARLKESE